MTMSILREFKQEINHKMQWIKGDIINKEYFDMYLPWAKFNMVSTEGESSMLVLTDDKSIIVGFASLHHDLNGIWLNNEMFYPKIKWKIKWLEINHLHREKGYGTIIINHIKNTFAETKTPIALYAKTSNTVCDLSLWYYKLGAIVLWNEEYPGVRRYQCFMDVNQVPEYIDDDETHDVNEIMEWENLCSNRRICKARYDKYMTCGWVLRNTESECSSCIERL